MVSKVMFTPNVNHVIVLFESKSFFLVAWRHQLLAKQKLLLHVMSFKTSRSQLRIRSGGVTSVPATVASIEQSVASPPAFNCFSSDLSAAVGNIQKLVPFSTMFVDFLSPLSLPCSRCSSVCSKDGKGQNEAEMVEEKERKRQSCFTESTHSLASSIDSEWGRGKGGRMEGEQRGEAADCWWQLDQSKRGGENMGVAKRQSM